MLVVKVDPFGLKLLQRGRETAPNVGGLAVLLPVLLLNVPRTELGGQEDLRTATGFGEPVAYDLLAWTQKLYQAVL